MVVKIFCVSVLWMGVGIMTLPIFLPLLAQSYGLGGSLTGLILCIPALTQIVTVPIFGNLVERMGIEMCICASGALFGVAFIAFGLSTQIEEAGGFLGMAIGTSVIVGLSTAANIVGEQALLLRYSTKFEREKNLGLFRSASGAGGLLSPLLGSAMFVWGGYMAAFMYCGIGYLLITPIIYR